jgi:IPT/TIG domain
MRNSPAFHAWKPALLSAALLAAACAEQAAPPTTVVVEPPPPQEVMATLRCEASVAGVAAVTCRPAAPPATGGARFDQRVIGGQGVYVRLASSNVSYGGGIYSADFTVQNLSSLELATADGAARHAAGVRVFFAGDVAVTGGTGAVTVANPTGTGTFTALDQDYFQYGGEIGGVDQGELGGDGILSPAETSSAKSWQFNVPATVTTFAFTLYVATETPAGAVTTLAPQVTAVSPSPLVPGQSATLTGYNFNATPGANTVTIGGAAATVTGGNATQLTVTVPCALSGTVPVQVTQGGMSGASLAHPLQGNQRTLAVGEAAVITTAGQVACNEITPGGGASRYVLAVYNTSTSPSSSAGFQLAGDRADLPRATLQPRAQRRPLRAAPSLDAQLAAAQARQSEERHLEILEMNRRENERLRARFAGDPRMRPSRTVVPNAGPPPATKTIRVVDLNGGSCNSYYTVNATRVYYSGKIAIYEDDATPAGLKAAANAAMQDYYNRIGDQYNADMEPVVRTHFGDPLLRDAGTDANGVLIALFTPLINNSFPGVAGFVVSCDQYPNGAGNGASNFGEYFYAYQPTVVGTGYASFTPDSWYWSIRSTFVHETKHVASQAARVAAGASFEQSWLEEGTARHSEELWARSAVYNVAWKGNTGYGSAAAPGSLYCDYRQTTPACVATDPSRPSLNMYRHFQTLYTFMRDPELLSPFGRSPSDNASYFYAISWSLVRYAIDRYGASDAAFLTALTSSTSTGTANLAARAGVSIEQLLGGWALSLYADDYPGLAAPGADLQMPTWNFRSVYAGMNADFPGSFPAAYPLDSEPLTFGSFAAVSVPSVVGGGAAYFELSGTHTSPQLVKVEAAGGGAPPSSLRLAIARVQ